MRGPQIGGNDPLIAANIGRVAHYLLYLHWKGNGKPIKLANGMLGYDGITRPSKWRAIVDLELRGLIKVERRPRKSPIITLLLI